MISETDLFRGRPAVSQLTLGFLRSRALRRSCCCGSSLCRVSVCRAQSRMRFQVLLAHQHRGRQDQGDMVAKTRTQAENCCAIKISCNALPAPNFA